MPIRVDRFRRQSPDYHRPLAGIPDHVVRTAWGITEIRDAWILGNSYLGITSCACRYPVSVQAWLELHLHTEGLLVRTVEFTSTGAGYMDIHFV